VQFDPAQHPHRRRNALTGDWVVVSPQRTLRPWQGADGGRPAADLPAHDSACYLCPGNERAGGVRNPDYASTFVFENDFAALLPDAPSPSAAHASSDPVLAFDGAVGECRVLCFSPRHDLTLAGMDADQLGTVIDLWTSQLDELTGRYEWIQIFETRGEISGASNPHPHGQVWASTFLPNEAVDELEQQRRHLATHGSRLLVDYVEREMRDRERVVYHDDHWVVVVPYWAYWPYETLVLPRRPVATLLEIDADERRSLAVALGVMHRAFDALFDVPFPYCSGWHTAPTSSLDHPEAHGWQLHAHYYPPLLRSATVAKIPASYELLANLQRDITPEQAAARLRAVG